MMVKQFLYDGRTGEPFRLNQLHVGVMYMLKLASLSR